MAELDVRSMMPPADEIYTPTNFKVYLFTEAPGDLLMRSKTLYSFSILSIAVLIWMYCLSWAFAKDAWGILFFDVFRLNADSLFWTFNVSYLVISILAVVLPVGHIFIVSFPRTRARFSPKWYSHIAAASLAWITIGAVSVAKNRSFPFADSTDDAYQTEQGAAANP